MEAHFEPVEGYRYSIQIVLLCVFIYARTSCGLRTVVEILKTFEDVLGSVCGKAPSYTTVRNWVLKLGLSAYGDDKTQKEAYAIIQDESITVNRQKLLLTLGIPSRHTGKPLTHSDAVVLDMRVADSHNKEDVRDAVDAAAEKVGRRPDYGVSDGGTNLQGGMALAEVSQHLDISHTLGNCMKAVYSEDEDFKSLTQRLGKIRLQYHLTDIAWLLPPPNMRAIARFMNLADWVEWGNRVLANMGSLEQKAKEAFGFLEEYRSLLEELAVDIDAVRYVETVCKTRGFSMETYRDCSRYILFHVIGNAENRRVRLGLRMLDYLKNEARLLHLISHAQNLSSDIIESNFGILKSKMSPNKLYGFTSQILLLPLYPRTIDYSVTDEQDFKVRLANVKLKEIDAWAKDNLSRNWVKDRAKTLKKAS